MAPTNDSEPGELYTTEDSEDDVIYPGNFMLFFWLRNLSHIVVTHHIVVVHAVGKISLKKAKTPYFHI